MLHIRFENAIQERLDLKLMSTTGQIVYQQLVNTLDADLIINIGHLPSGIYFLYAQNTLLQKTIKY
jgi:hypothetical protein